jgi:type VII secretion protein EccE
MTQAPASTRPPGPATGPADRPVVPADRRRQGRIGPVVVGQLVTLELGLLGVWVASRGPDWLFGTVTAGAVLLLAGVFARRGGRWLYEDLLLRRRLRNRRRTARRALAHTADDPRLAALAPEVSLVELTERGNRLGIGRDGRGWFAALALTEATGSGSAGTGAAGPGAAGTGSGVPAEAVDRALGVLRDFTGPVTATQVVAQTLVWYPTPGAPPAAHRTVWVALRISVPQARVEAVSRGGGVAGVHRTVATGVGRLGKALTAAGLGHRVLGRQELRAALISASGLDLAPEAPTESWTGLRGGGWSQRCLSLRVRPGAPLAGLVEAVTGTSAPSHTLAAVVLPGGRPVPPLLRVAAPDEHADALLTVVREQARRYGTPARPLHGQHGPGVYATAPCATAAGTLAPGT